MNNYDFGNREIGFNILPDNLTGNETYKFKVFDWGFG